jgi:rubrerythrin
MWQSQTENHPLIGDLYSNLAFKTTKKAATHGSYSIVNKWRNFWKLIECPDKFKCVVCGVKISLADKKYPVCGKHRPLFMLQVRRGLRPDMPIQKPTVC